MFLHGAVFLFTVTLGRGDRQVVVIKVHTNVYTLFTRMTYGSHSSTGFSQKRQISYGIKFASMLDGTVEMPVSLYLLGG